MKFPKVTSLAKQLKIRTKLILLMIVITYFSVITVGLLSYTVGRDIIDKQINQVLSIQTETTLEAVNKLIYDRFNDMQLLISDSTLSNDELSGEEKTKVLKNSLINLGWYDQLHLTNPSGSIVASTLKTAIGTEINSEKWYLETKDDFINVSDVTISPFSEKDQIIFTNKVQNTDNMIVGTLIAEFPLNVIQDLLKKAPENIEAYLTTNNGKIIAQKGPNKEENPSVSGSNHYQYNPNYLRQQIKSDGYFSFDGNDWKLVAQIPKSIAYAPINRFALFLIIILGFIALPIIAIGHISSKRFVRPILSLSEGVGKMRRGNLRQKIAIEYHDEVGFLAQGFNHMSSDLAEKTENLLEEKGKYKSILESADEGIILFDKQNNAIAFNNKFADMFMKNGKRAKLKKADKIFNFFNKKNVVDESKKLVEKIQKLISQKDFKKSFSGEITIKTPTYRILYLYTKPVLAEDKKLLGRIWVLNDITNEVESERSKNEFVKVASHKLRTPITTLNWNLQMLLDGSMGKLSKEQKGIIQQAEESADHLHSLSQILMSAAEIKNDKVTLKKEAFSILDVVKKVKELAEKKLAGQRKVSVKFNEKGLKSARIKGDPDKLEQMLSALIENAILYGKEGKKNEIKVNFNIDKKTKKLTISVEDQGIGISDEDKPKVFTKFFRGEQAYLIHTEGTGLSLFLAKIIQNSAHEKLWFESEPGKGSTFYLTTKLA